MLFYQNVMRYKENFNVLKCTVSLTLTNQRALWDHKDLMEDCQQPALLEEHHYSQHGSYVHFAFVRKMSLDHLRYAHNRRYMVVHLTKEEKAAAVDLK